MTNFSNRCSFSETSSLVESEALAWIAQLNGDNISEQDLAAFREWVNRSPAHQREIKELSQLWSGLNYLTTMDEPIRRADSVAKQLRKRQSRRVWFKRAIVPVCSFAIALIVVFGLPNVPTMSTDSILSSEEVRLNVPVFLKTEKGEFQVYTLEDGSKITLNTNSHIEVNFSKSQRDVRLLKGEAFFSVAHDEKRPFLVFANDGIVRAVGTAFSVHLKDDGINVLVSEGSVELSAIEPILPTSIMNYASDESAQMTSLGIIKAGHSAKIADRQASISIVSNETISSELSWRSGRLDFTGEGLEEAIKEYTRYTDQDIKIIDSEIKDIRVGGSFPTGETDLFFKTLELQFGIKVEKVEENSVSLSKAQ